MTPEQREALTAKHDNLIDEFNKTESRQTLDDIAWIEFVLFNDPDRPLHSCDDEECIVCN